MKLRGVLIGLLLCSLAALGGWAVAQLPPTPPPITGQSELPNLVLVVWDTTRTDHLGATGPDAYQGTYTPALNALAADGVVYTRARSSAPWTLPSHLSMFTGQLPGTHQGNWLAYAEQFSFSRLHLDEERLLANRLETVGYQTVAVSSNPWLSNQVGGGFGFDTFLQYWDLAPRPLAARLGLRPDEDADRTWNTFGEQSPPLEQPFFGFFHFIDPHQPYHRFAPGDHAAYDALAAQPESERKLLTGKVDLPEGEVDALYDAEIDYTDTALARLISWLKAEGVYDDTLIVVTSDHGEHLGERGKWSHQLSVDEELLRVPLVVKWPESRDAGTTIDARTIDTRGLYATFLRAAGIDAGGPSLEAPEAVQIAEYYWSEPYLQALVKENPAFDPSPHRVVRRVAATDTLRVELADEAVRKAERWDGAPPRAEAVQALVDRLAAHAATVQRPVPAGTERAEDTQVDALLHELGYIGDD